jgi:hypothetical protein
MIDCNVEKSKQRRLRVFRKFETIESIAATKEKNQLFFYGRLLYKSESNRLTHYEN